MDSNNPDHEQVRLSDVVKRGIAIADANIIFIAFFFVANLVMWFAFARIRSHLAGPAEASDAELLRKLASLYLLLVSVPVGALMDALFGALLRTQVVPGQPASSAGVFAWTRRFYFRMLLLSAVQGMAYVLAYYLVFPFGSILYVPLRYATAFVIWQDCGVRKAIAGTSGFLTAHSGKFFPVWFAGMTFLVFADLVGLTPAAGNPVFTGLVHLVWTYFEFALMATALVFFLRLQPKQQEVLA
jgi:hypothetical protein